jgi:hypothetical protein
MAAEDADDAETNSANGKDSPEKPNRVQCAACGREVDEDEAQAQRWGYWSDSSGEIYPYCPECAERLGGPRSPSI